MLPNEKIKIKNVSKGTPEFKTPTVFLRNLHPISPKRQQITEYAARKILCEEFELVKFTKYDGPATLKHQLCGNMLGVNNFKSFIRYNRCPHCGPNPGILPVETRKERFISSLSSKFNDEYTLVGPYINLDTPTLFIHNLPKGCGKPFEMKPSEICRYKYLCPHCRRKSILANKPSDEDINKILNAVSSGKYSMIRRGKTNHIWIQNNENRKAKRMGYKKAIAYLEEHIYSELP